MYYLTMRDYVDKYGNTYIGIRDGGNIVPFFVKRVEGEVDNPIFVGHKLHEDGRFHVDLMGIQAKQDNVLLNPPKVGMFGGAGRLSYAYRRPQRRWKQGFELNNYSIKEFVTAPDDRRTNIWELFNPIDMPVERASELVRNSRMGIRVNRFAGVVGDGSKHPSLVYRSKTIGRVKGDKIVIPSNCSELLDTVKRLGDLDVEVRELKKKPAEDKAVTSLLRFVDECIGIVGNDYFSTEEGRLIYQSLKSSCEEGSFTSSGLLQSMSRTIIKRAQDDNESFRIKRTAVYWATLYYVLSCVSKGERLNLDDIVIKAYSQADNYVRDNLHNAQRRRYGRNFRDMVSKLNNVLFRIRREGMLPVEPIAPW